MQVLSQNTTRGVEVDSLRATNVTNFLILPIRRWRSYNTYTYNPTSPVLYQPNETLALITVTLH